MKKCVLTFMAFIISTSFSICAETGSGSQALSGVGALSCKAYLNLVDDKNDNTRILSDQVFVWVQGFMSGLNLSTLYLTKNTGMSVNLNGMSNDEKGLFLRSYCTKNKGEHVYQAAEQLYDELSNQEMGK
jgi:hypothetical protein